MPRPCVEHHAVGSPVTGGVYDNPVVFVFYRYGVDKVLQRQLEFRVVAVLLGLALHANSRQKATRQHAECILYYFHATKIDKKPIF